MRSQALSSLTPQTLYIHMSPWMCSEMNPFIRSQSNDRHWFITDVSIISLAFPFPLLLPFGAIAVSWKWIYIQNVSIMIQLHVAEGSPEGKWGKIQRCVGYRVGFGTRGVVLSKSRDVKMRMLSVCIIREQKRKEVYAGRRDIYTQVSVMSWFNLWVLLVNERKMAQPSFWRTTCHLMNDKPRDKI